MRALAGVPMGVWLAVSAQAQPCCGPVTPRGRQLASFLESSDAVHLWRSGWHVDWRTGERDRPAPGGPAAKTHCSAFVAALALRLGIYVLRPPQHSQQLLANAQMRWLHESGEQSGWSALGSDAAAQEAANGGWFVVEAYENPDRHRPGHIAIVRPSEKTRTGLHDDGPQETQAGTHNAFSMTTREGFRAHRGAWEPGGGGSLRYYRHDVAWP